MSKVEYQYENLQSAAARLRELKDNKDKVESDLKQINSEISYLELNYLPEYFENNEIEKITLEEIGTIYIRGDLYVSMSPAELLGDEAPFYDWARDNVPDLVTQYIHPARLKSWAKESLEQGRPIPTNMLKTTMFQRATLRRK